MKKIDKEGEREKKKSERRLLLSSNFLNVFNEMKIKSQVRCIALVYFFFSFLNCIFVVVSHFTVGVFL